jgi:hypothetical protein
MGRFNDVVDTVVDPSVRSFSLARRDADSSDLRTYGEWMPRQYVVAKYWSIE